MKIAKAKALQGCGIEHPFSRSRAESNQPRQEAISWNECTESIKRLDRIEGKVDQIQK